MTYVKNPTMPKMAGNDPLFRYTDRNTLRKITAPTPNGLIRAAKT